MQIAQTAAAEYRAVCLSAHLSTAASYKRCGGMFGGMIAKQVEEELTRNYGNYGRTKDVFSQWTSSAVGLDVVVEYRLGFVG